MHHESFDSCGHFYTFYYDESNNDRKLYINKNKDSYNIDNDKNKEVVAGNFMLGGVAHRGKFSTANVDVLFADLHLQKSAKELKLNQVATGSFDMMLNSQQIRTLLQWLLESDLYLHYFNLNIEYWSFIDIIDDCVLYCRQRGVLVFDSGEHYRYYLDYHKDALYRVIRARKSEFIAMVKRYRYPTIEGKEGEFVTALKALVNEYVKQLTSLQPMPGPEDFNPLRSLVELLDLCLEIDDMTLTLGTEENVLIDGFSVFYQHRTMSFLHSEHIFDEEDEVEGDIKLIVTDETHGKIQCRFVKSILTPLTQVSDVVAGLYARYFDYIEKSTHDDLVVLAARLNPRQQKTLALMKALIEKTDRECPRMLFYVMTLSEHDKHRMFLFPEVD